MKSPKNIALAVLAAAVLALGGLAWHAYGELAVLRAQLADGNLVALKKQLAAAEKTIRSLEDRLAALRGRRGGPGPDGEEAGDDPNGPGAWRRGGRFGAFETLSGNPDFQKLLAIQMKGRINQTYAPLFKALNLSPEQLAQFQSLLAEKQQALMDTLQAARAQGINPRSDPQGFQSLMSQAVAQTDQSIQQVLGDAGFQEYQQYQQTLPERNVVTSLQQQLSYSQTPLTDDEANQLISLLAQNQPEHAGNGTAASASNASVMSLLNNGGNARVTDAAVTAAAGVLSAPQVSALQQIQQQQQAQAQIQQMMRAANQGSGPAAPSAPVAGGSH